MAKKAQKKTIRDILAELRSQHQDKQSILELTNVELLKLSMDLFQSILELAFSEGLQPGQLGHHLALRFQSDSRLGSMLYSRLGSMEIEPAVGIRKMIAVQQNSEDPTQPNELWYDSETGTWYRALSIHELTIPRRRYLDPLAKDKYLNPKGIGYGQIRYTEVPEAIQQVFVTATWQLGVTIGPELLTTLKHQLEAGQLTQVADLAQWPVFHTALVAWDKAHWTGTTPSLTIEEGAAAPMPPFPRFKR